MGESELDRNYAAEKHLVKPRSRTNGAGSKQFVEERRASVKGSKSIYKWPSV
jgi:hypothetical protein